MSFLNIHHDEILLASKTDVEYYDWKEDSNNDAANIDL